MKFLVYSFIVCCIYLDFSNCILKRQNNDDYYSYDYDQFNNSQNNPVEYSKLDSLILPAPEIIETKNEPPFEDDFLPDDSLADSDLQDHNIIDNLMYVYYGSKTKSNYKYGPEVIVIGSVLSCAAQLLSIFCIILKKNTTGKKENTELLLHVMGCMCFSNLIFMLGVHATKNALKCKIIAVCLYYLHLITSFWIFAYCYYFYHRFVIQSLSSIRFIYFLAYGLPFFISLTSLILTPKSYETKKFCFISLEGLLINYMFPNFCLITATMVYTLNGIRRINLELSKLDITSSTESLNISKNEFVKNNDDMKTDSSETSEEIQSLKEYGACFRLLLFLQTCFAVVWFLSVTALETANLGVGISVIYSLFSSFFNWYILSRISMLTPTILVKPPNCNMISYFEEKCNDSSSFVEKSKGQEQEISDDIPLLFISTNSSNNKDSEEFISTITS